MNIKQSKWLAWAAMLLIVVVVIVTISMGYIVSLWDYLSIFFAFMMVFCHLMALNLRRMSLNASKKLDMAAFIFGILTFLAITLIFILYLVAL